MKIDEIDCWIEAEGEALDEYGAEPSEENKTCVAWVPSQVGQVWYSQHSPRLHLLRACRR
ncbi:uncharacterized protein SCHCODRAFT_02642635 [Schizophyllum commune H4-8]|uniref:uncharacterized protein n=1 Tax=Schizophyllum commune (strain H4-8 / FGSC 9210) TaxID=578458 RepID=UPI00215FEE22|nr:uncharacterized protein SCHCODRAFT_02642635 [Schizophyllum commune H4-8]KAI5885854.1 hypothetical protein SCHCODRAFT_02642635 [Schizophyllum commune H4-8]